MSDLDARVEATRRRYQEMRDDPMTPQGLTGMGQSGSMLDYQESEEIGTMICAEKGHLWAGGDEGKPTRFCLRCGIRLRKSTGEMDRIYHREWEDDEPA